MPENTETTELKALDIKINDLISMAITLANRIRAVEQRLHGEPPSAPATETSSTYCTGGVLGVLNVSLDTLRVELSDCHDEIEKLERL